MTDSRDTRLARARVRAERRERIATAVLAASVGAVGPRGIEETDVHVAIGLAEMLTNALDAMRAAEEAQA